MGGDERIVDRQSRRAPETPTVTGDDAFHLAAGPDRERRFAAIHGVPEEPRYRRVIRCSREDGADEG